MFNVIERSRMGSRHATPVFLVANGQGYDQPIVLTRRARGGENDQLREEVIQKLVHDHPAIIPIAEIEPGLSPLVSICREMPVGGGYAVDNFWMTPGGGLVVGECKLVRNPEARREVVAQVLDYARLMGGWHYDDLERAAQQARKDPKFRLWSAIEAQFPAESQREFDEPQFIDAVERRLRVGQILLIIVGDGIQEGVEALTSLLQLHAGMHATLVLLELSLWRGLQGGLLVVPRIPMRTVIIERGVVTIDQAGSVRITAPAQPTGGRPKATTQSEAEYFDRFGAKVPELVEQLKAFLGSLGEVGVSPEYRRSAVLRFYPSPDITASAGFIDANGQVWLNDAASAAARAGRPEAAQRYLEAVAVATGGKVNPPTNNVVTLQGSVMTISILFRNQSAWREAIARFVEELQSAASASPEASIA